MGVYRKKFVRTDAPPENFRIQPRDRQLLEDVAEYRFLDMGQILALYEGGERNLRRRVSNLYHLGYLERPSAQKTLPAWSSIIYSLGDKGKELLERKEAIRRKQVGFPYLSHAMMISQFRATLTLALKNYPSHPKIERWSQGYDLRDELASRGQRPELVPDAFFTIRGDDGARDFFLEADQSTMEGKRVLAKMRTYWKWHREKRIQKILGIENFRVLTITISEKRAENLRRITKNADDRQTGSNMFLFLSETQYSLKKPEAMLAPIWASAKGEKHGILE